MTSSIIKVESLSKSVKTAEGELSILKAISFQVKQGESVALVGTSGSGKSTLLGLMAGLDLASSGDVEIDGIRLSSLDEEQRAILRRDKIGFIFQSFMLVPGLTALENVMLPLELKGETNARGKALALLGKVNLAQRARHMPNQLSGGEQQRVAIARAFITAPKLLLADEPTGNLDTTTGKHIESLLFELNQQHNTTLLVVTHDEKLASRCQRQLKMDVGELVEVTHV